MEIIESTRNPRSTFLAYEQLREENFDIISENYSNFIKQIRETNEVKLRKELMAKFLNNYLVYDIRLHNLRVQYNTTLDWIDCNNEIGEDWYIFFDFENLTYNRRSDKPIIIPDDYDSFSRYIY